MTYVEDLNSEGFFAVTAKTFDKKIRLLHTNRANFRIAQEWHLEKTAVRFFDMHMLFKGGVGSRESVITLLGLDSNRFCISRFECKEEEPEVKKGMMLLQAFDVF